MAADTPIRAMQPADLVAGQRLSAGFHWAHRLEDWALMLEVGEGVVAERDGTVAGTAMAWRYGADAATVGMIIVAEQLHGQGMGRRLLQTLLDRLDGRTIRLNATPEGMKLYRALGFVEHGHVTSYRTEAAGGGAAPPTAGREVTAADLGWIAALDQAACGMDRSRLLDALLAAGGGIALEQGGTPVAAALHRRFGRGQLIGPVVARDAQAARLLVGQLLGQLAGEFVRIDTPDTGAFGAWLASQGLQSSAPVIGMTRGGGGALPGGAQCFAIASQAYG